MTVEYRLQASEACRAHGGNNSSTIVAIRRFDCQENGDRACVFFDETGKRTVDQHAFWRPRRRVHDEPDRLLALRTPEVRY